MSKILTIPAKLVSFIYKVNLSPYMNKKRLWKVLAVIGILCWVVGGNYGGDVMVSGGLAFLGLVVLISAWVVWNKSRKNQ